MDLSREDVIRTAKTVLEKEAQAISNIATTLGDDFVAAVKVILGCQGKVILIGIGKSGHVGRKIAATLASLGTPAFFLHAAEAVHGDLGMITKNDIVILISHSGETLEVVRLLDPIEQIGALTISITGKKDCSLAREAKISLITGVTEEADSLNLAPTSSATATLALGDALAVSLAVIRGFTRKDFRFFHPGGALGARLSKEI